MYAVTGTVSLPRPHHIRGNIFKIMFELLFPRHPPNSVPPFLRFALLLSPSAAPFKIRIAINRKGVKSEHIAFITGFR